MTDVTKVGCGPGESSVSPRARPGIEPRPKVSVAATTSRPRREPPPGPSLSVFGSMLEAISASSPPGWAVTLDRDRLDEDWRLHGTVDDGSGPGSLLGDFTVRPRIL